jgi:hypothetical protein
MKTTVRVPYAVLSVVALGFTLLVASGAEQQTPRSARRDRVELRRQMQQQLLAKYDLNKNGRLEPDERAVLQRDLAAQRRGGPQVLPTGQGALPTAPALQPPKMKPVERKQAIERSNRELFLRHDKNGDGVLDADEETALWTEWRLKLHEKQAKDAAK